MLYPLLLVHLPSQQLAAYHSAYVSQMAEVRVPQTAGLWAAPSHLVALQPKNNTPNAPPRMACLRAVVMVAVHTLATDLVQRNGVGWAATGRGSAAYDPRDSSFTISSAKLYHSFFTHVVLAA